MPFPEPYAGLVIRYSYLWKREHEAGREEGTKDRPCAVVVAIIDQDGEWDVLVLPITHSPPPNPADAVEIPTETKKRGGAIWHQVPVAFSCALFAAASTWAASRRTV